MMRKKIYACILITGIAACVAVAFSFIQKNEKPAELKPEEKHELVCREIVNLVTNFNYKKVSLDDSLSSVIFDAYIKALDGNKVYFLESDIHEFESYRNQLDDMLRMGDINIPFQIFNRYIQRYTNRIQFMLDNLYLPADFTTSDELIYDRSKLEWMKTVEELDAYWMKRIKYDLLNLSLAGSDSAKSRETLKKRYENLLNQSSKINNYDAFQAIMTAFTESVDPHTDYYNPSNAANFNVDMARSLEGIGATLRMDNDYVTINAIVPGGPADKIKQLNIDDKIIAVAQGKDGEFEDIIGWRLDVAIQLIRGAKGTIVRLKILPKGQDISSEPKIVEIVREKIVLQDQSAKYTIKTVQQGNKAYKIGIIDIPAFYADFKAYQAGDPNYKSTTRDVRLLLDTLKQEDVHAVVIDLRSNGGGSLMEAIDLTGLFIKTGPVVQVRNTRNQIESGEDDDPSIAWEGTLVVMIDRFSASASEIFAGAVQDYGRGIVIGTQSYGKGTVQNSIDLDQVMGNRTPANKNVVGKTNTYGQINLTIAKFYRINGSSTQHKGISPDIAFPMIYSAQKYGESSKASALPWDEIRRSNYKIMADLSVVKKELNQEHNKRMKSSKEYQYLLNDIEEFNKKDIQVSVCLHIDSLKKEREEKEQINFMRENERRVSRGLEPLKKDEAKPKHETPYDFMLEETVLIVADYLNAIK